MILRIEDWVFDVDMESTMEYSAKEAADHCDCGYCRNFYAAVDDTYPNLRPFLAQFGLDIEAPDELMPFDLDSGMLYDGFYAVSGKILQYGKVPCIVDGLRIDPDLQNTLGMIASCPKPCFFLNVSDLILPWVLDVPMEDVISPANQPSFLRRMYNRLLGKRSNIMPPS